jgi:hydrogenase nickel incorporation protein HypA/HybF
LTARLRVMSQHAIISMHRCRFSPVQISHTGRRQGDARDAMHELAITQNIVDIALKSAPERQVQGITIVLGELSGIVEDSVRFCFEVVAADTAAKGAALTFHKVPAHLRCTKCAFEFKLDNGDWACPQCGNLGGEVLQGRECYIESIDVEDE